MSDVSRQAIQSAMLKLVEFTVDELGEALDISTYKDRGAITRVVRRFVHSGRVERTGNETYRYKGHMLDTPRMKMWRAMLVKVRFTQEDIVKLSGASRSTARKFFLSIKKHQLIAHVTGRGYENSLYQLIDPDNAPLEPSVGCRQEISKQKGGEIIE